MRYNGFEEFQEFPKMLYNKDGDTRVVASLEEEQKAGLEWQFTPGGQPLGAPEVRRGRGRPRESSN